MKLEQQTKVKWLIIALGIASFAGQISADHSKSRHGAIWWETSQGEVLEKGAFAFTVSQTELIRRLAIRQSDSGWRAVLTDGINSVNGIDSLELRDDRSGWWIRSEIHYPTREDSLHELFQAAYRNQEESATVTMRMGVITSSGFEQLVDLPATADVDAWAQYAEQLWDQELATDLATDVPESFREVVWFLDAEMKDWQLGISSEDRIADQPRGITDLLKILSAILSAVFLDGREPEMANGPRTLKTGKALKGRIVTDADLLVALHPFRTLDPKEPLSDSMD
ncbi:MAG: hypothetical protein AAF481_18365 [Acidobacteriota bacterium]